MTRFVYDRYEIKEGKEGLPGLPATFGDAAAATTLLIHLKDDVAKLSATLSFAVFPRYDAIVRSFTVSNDGEEEVVLESAASFSVDMAPAGEGREMIQLSGEWAREAQIISRTIYPGFQG